MDRNFWVFAYGSLMWNPGIPFLESRPARLFGWSRRLCIYSLTYRGTKERPGLVLGLDRGGSCRGIAYLVEPAMRARLDEREMLGNVYTPRIVQTHLEDGRKISALIYAARKESPEYAGDLPDAEIARILKTARGNRGTSRDYLAETVGLLDKIGCGDKKLSRLLAAIDREQNQ